MTTAPRRRPRPPAASPLRPLPGGDPAAARPSRAAELVAELRDEILRGARPPGARLPAERELAETRGLSRSSVREALQQLEQLGLVAIRHGGGAVVRPVEDASLDVLPHLLLAPGAPRRDLVEQALEVQATLMGAAVRLALRHADAGERAGARALLRRLADPAIGDAEYFGAIEALVQLVSSASRNLVLRLVRNGLRSALLSPELRRWIEGERGLRAQLRPPREVLRPVVRRIEQALADGDAAAAEESVQRLFAVTREHLLRALDEASGARRRATRSRRPGGAPA
ncbi:MAG TPA: GntR family transcriptional regulator [Myxococcota bacterium]|nr:GntR family transcriptional regulator [Myxococcota bacterium]